MKARQINDTIRYTMWSVFRQDGPVSGAPEAAAQARASSEVAAATEGGDLEIRGWYDVAGLRADADLMVWWHAPTSETLQDAYHALRRSALGRSLDAGVVAAGAAPSGRVQQGSRAGVHGGRGGAGASVRLPVRALVRVVSAAR